MKTVTAIVALICLTFSGLQSVRADECDPAQRFPCQVRIIESVHVRLDGSARELGIDGEQIAKSVRDRLRERVPNTVKVQIEPSASAVASGLPRDRRSRFACTLWTVGKFFTLSMFVECGLESVTGDWAVESRLLGHIRHSDLQESVQLALAKVVDNVVERLQRASDAPAFYATRLDRRPAK